MIFITNFISQLFFIIVGVVGISFLVGFHELGHFLFCKLFGIKAPSFSIGMGPRLITKKIGETDFSISAIPLGGYVEIAELDEKAPPAERSAYFSNRPYWQKLCVTSGGILFNLIFAYLVLSFLYYAGMPRISILYPLHASTTLQAVTPDSPAQQAGLKAGDLIKAINGVTMDDAMEVTTFVQKHPNQAVTLQIMRDNESKEMSVTLSDRNKLATAEKVSNQEPVGFLGADFVIPKFSLIESLNKGLSATYHLTLQVIKAFKGLFVNHQFNNLGGPLAVIAQTVKGARHGFKVFLLLLTFISINLAVLNVIPLPIMDGGQALYYTIEAIIRRPLPNKVREYIHYATWALVLLLVIYLSIKDFISLCFS